MLLLSFFFFFFLLVVDDDDDDNEDGFAFVVVDVDGVAVWDGFCGVRKGCFGGVAVDSEETEFRGRAGDGVGCVDGIGLD